MIRCLLALAGATALGVMGATSAAARLVPETPSAAPMATAMPLIASSDEETKHDGMEEGHEASPGQVQGMGTVIVVKADQNMVIVDHQDIPGCMDAMTMGFTVADPSLLVRVAAGDMVRFTVETETGQILEIEKAHR